MNKLTKFQLACLGLGLFSGGFALGLAVAMMIFLG